MNFNEKFGLALLTVACLFMAGLNLWIEFKGWFNKRYQRRESSNRKQDSLPPKNKNYEKEKIPDFVGKSKFKMPTKNEEENQSFYSVDAKPEEQKDDPVEPEEEIVPLNIISNKNATHDQGITTDEFELLAKTLQGKPVSTNEKEQVPQILQKVQGADLFGQFIEQVKGAEGIASKILRDFEEDNEVSDNSNSGFDVGRFARK